MVVSARLQLIAAQVHTITFRILTLSLGIQVALHFFPDFHVSLVSEKSEIFRLVEQFKNVLAVDPVHNKNIRNWVIRKSCASSLLSGSSGIGNGLENGG